jgi:hypothetical protein
MKVIQRDIDIRRTLERLEKLLDTANDSGRVNQLENRLIRACEAEEKWYEKMFRLGDWKAVHKSIRAGQLLRYAQEIVARHKNWQETLAIC